MAEAEASQEFHSKTLHDAYLDRLLDQALADSFPASDPVAISFPVGVAAERDGHESPTSAATPRLDSWKIAPEGMAAFRHLQIYLGSCGLEPTLLELVKIRASQLNGCGYCLDMHTRDARAAGESEQRLFTLSAWREAPFFDARERAALAWTEAVTRISPPATGDALFESMRQVFNDREIVDVTLAVIAINGWNRLAITFRTPVGSYRLRRVAERE